MKKLLPLVVFGALAGSLPGLATAQGAAAGAAVAKAPGVRAAGAAIELRARVVELDTVRRTATLKGPKGRVVTVDVPAEVKNFDQVRVGDELVVRYVAAALAQLEPASKSGIRERVESTGAAAAAPGALPGLAGQRTVEVLMVIQSLDRKARQATLRGVKRTVAVEVPEGIDLDKVKVGDEVRARLVEAAVLDVERVGAGK
jgi:hypothetical protein